MACRRAATELQCLISAAQELAANAYKTAANPTLSFEAAEQAALHCSEASTKVQQAIAEVDKLTAEAHTAAQKLVAYCEELDNAVGRLEDEKKVAWTRREAELTAREHAVQQKAAELRLKEQVLMTQHTAIKISVRIERAESQSTARAAPATAARPTAALQTKTTAEPHEAAFGEVGQNFHVKDHLSTDQCKIHNFPSPKTNAIFSTPWCHP